MSIYYNINYQPQLQLNNFLLLVSETKTTSTITIITIMMILKTCQMCLKGSAITCCTAIFSTICLYKQVMLWKASCCWGTIFPHKLELTWSCDFTKYTCGFCILLSTLSATKTMFGPLPGTMHFDALCQAPKYHIINRAGNTVQLVIRCQLWRLTLTRIAFVRKLHHSFCMYILFVSIYRHLIAWFVQQMVA